MQAKDADIPVKRLVLVGGGHAHVHVLKMLGMDPMPGLAITLITRDIETPYSGMIPGFVAGHYVREECHVDLAKLCSFAGVTLVHGEACGLDRSKQEVYCKDGRPPIRYDVLSFDIGISPKPLPLVFQSNRPTITPVKPIDGFSYRWDIILSRVLSIEMDGKPVRLAIVGGGAGGTELCFAMHHRLQQEMLKVGKDTSLLHVTLFNRGSSLIAQHNQHVQNILHRIAREKGITVELNTEIVAVEMKGELNEGTPDTPSDTTSPPSSSTHGSDQLVSKDGRKFPFDEAIWCTDAVGQAWIKQTGLETTNEGFICVGATLESVNSPGIFACGDIAHLVASPRPKAGVFAVRAGPPLTLNLRKKLLNQLPLEPWTPQEQFLGLIGTGDAYAVASKGPIGIEGAFLWKLKDRIDRTWMALYNDLPDKERMMKQKQKQAKQAFIASIVASCGQSQSGPGQGPTQGLGPAEKEEIEKEEDLEEYSAVARSMGIDTLNVLTQAKMRCGGCGSKVGAQLLTRALRRVQHSIHDRKEVISGIGNNSPIHTYPLTPSSCFHTTTSNAPFNTHPLTHPLTLTLSSVVVVVVVVADSVAHCEAPLFLPFLLSQHTLPSFFTPSLCCSNPPFLFHTLPSFFPPFLRSLHPLTLFTHPLRASQGRWAIRTRRRRLDPPSTAPRLPSTHDRLFSVICLGSLFVWSNRCESCFV